ncbi:MAG: hypothetical protein IPI67_20910 [Myxococcales bacterium]|nr:hypothetical protein [Myxococcales bacterium]
MASHPEIALDTNVLLDILSWHDLMTTVDRLHAHRGDDVMLDPAVTYRLARARESTLLAIYLNRTRANTYNLLGEGVRLMIQQAPPAAPGSPACGYFVPVALHFVKDYLLPDWTLTVDPYSIDDATVQSVETLPGNQVGSAADRALLEYAKTHGVPLITNEGNTPRGMEASGLRKLAIDQGVEVYSPREFYEGHLAEADEIESFIQRFKEEAPRFLRERPLDCAGDQMGELLDYSLGYYRMILLGIAAGRDAPVPVRTLPVAPAAPPTPGAV